MLATHYYGNQNKQDGDGGLIWHVGKSCIVVLRTEPLVRDTYDIVKTDIEEITRNWVKKIQLG
jgi:hypothetical protein